MSISILKRPWFLIVLGLGMVALGYYFYRGKASQKTYTYAKVSRGVVEQTIDVPGNVDATVKAKLKFLAGGKLVSLPVVEGQAVKKGQAIASIDARDLQKNLESSLRDYSSTRTDFEQGIDDRKDQALSDTLRRASDKLQYSLDRSVISVELKDIALRNATLVSPIDGIMTSVPVDTTGVQVIATDAFEIVNPNSLYFEAEVDEADIGLVKAGDLVRISLNAYPDHAVDGVISSIALQARSSSKSSGGTIFPVKVLLPDVSISTFRLGMNGTMTIILAKRENTLYIPIETTTQTDGKVTVRVRSPTDPAGEVRQIKTGIEGQATVEVISGLTQDDEVALP